MFQSRLPGHQVSFYIYHSGLISLGLEQSGNVNTKKNYLENLSLLIFPRIQVALSMKIQNSTLTIVKIIIVVAQFHIKVVVQDTSVLW